MTKAYIRFTLHNQTKRTTYAIYENVHGLHSLHISDGSDSKLNKGRYQVYQARLRERLLTSRGFPSDSACVLEAEPVKLFQKMVILHIKLNGITNTRIQDPLPRPLVSKGQNSTFPENGHVAYQTKGSRMQQHGSKYFARRPPPLDPGCQKVEIHFFSEHSHVAYQLKGITNAATW